MPTPKPRKVGRPKLPKGEAKGRTIQVRLTADDLKLIPAAAKASKRAVSEWIRDALRTTAEVSMFKRTLHEAMRIILLEQPNHTASTSVISEKIDKRGLYQRKDGAEARAGQISARARQYPELFTILEPGTIRLSSSSSANSGISASA